MKCKRCCGTTFLDRVFTDNKFLETSCLQCGDRRFYDKRTPTGTMLAKIETAMERSTNGL